MEENDVIEVIERLVSSYGFNREVLKKFFKQNLYNLQEFLVGEVVKDSSQADGMRTIQIGYALEEDDILYFDAVQEDFNEIDSELSGIPVIATILSLRNNDVMLEEYEDEWIKKRVAHRMRLLQENITDSFSTHVDNYNRREIVSRIYNLTHTCALGLYWVCSEPNRLLELEKEIIDIFLNYYRTLITYLEESYSDFMPEQIVLQNTYERGFELQKEIPMHRLKSAFKLLVDKEKGIFHPDTKFAQFENIFNQTAPFQKIQLAEHARILDLSLFVKELRDKNIVRKDKEFRQSHWKTTLNCFVDKQGNQLNLNTINSNTTQHRNGQIHLVISTLLGKY